MRTTYPSIVVLVKHADELARLELELVFHAGLEVELDTVDIVGTTRSHGHCSRGGNLGGSRSRRYGAF